MFVSRFIFSCWLLRFATNFMETWI